MKQKRDVSWHEKFEADIAQVRDDLYALLGAESGNISDFDRVATCLFDSTLVREHLAGLYAYTVFERLQLAQRLAREKKFDLAESALKSTRSALVQLGKYRAV